MDIVRVYLPKKRVCVSLLKFLNVKGIIIGILTHLQDSKETRGGNSSSRKISLSEVSVLTRSVTGYKLL